MSAQHTDIDAENVNLDDKIIAGLARISNLFRAELWEHAKHLKISPLQAQILVFCANNSALLCSVSGFAAEFSVSKPTISDAVKTLLAKNLLQKNQGADKRGFLLTLTAEGEKVTEQLAGYTENFKTQLGKIWLSDKETVWQGVKKLLEILG